MVAQELGSHGAPRTIKIVKQFWGKLPREFCLDPRGASVERFLHFLDPLSGVLMTTCFCMWVS